MPGAIAGAVGSLFFAAGASLAVVNAVTFGTLFAVQIGIGLGISAAAGALTGALLRRGTASAIKPSDGQETIRQEVTPRRQTLGTLRVGGALWWAATDPGAPTVLYHGLVLGHGRIGEIKQFYIDRKLTDLDTSDAVISEPWASGAGTSIFSRLGLDTETAYSEIDAAFGIADVRGDGLCTCLLEATNETTAEAQLELWPNGIRPDITALIDGLAVYDPRGTSAPDLICTNTDNGSDLTDAYTYEFSSLSIGAAPDASARERRFVFVCAGGLNSGSIDAIGVDIAGYETIFVEHQVDLTGGVSSGVLIFYAEIPGSDTTIDVTVGFTAAMLGCAVSVFRVISGHNGIEIQSGNLYEDTGDDPSVSVDDELLAGSVFIACAANVNGDLTTWVNLANEAQDTDLNTNDHFTAAYEAFGSDQSIPYTITANFAATAGNAALAGCKISKRPAMDRADSTTWNPSENTAVHGFHYAFINPDGYGLGYDRVSGNLGQWAAAMDACDEDFDLDSGETEKRYRLAMSYYLTDDPVEVMARIRAAADMKIWPKRDGQIGVSIGKFTPPSVVIASKDIIGWSELTRGQGKLTAVAGVRAQFVSPDHEYVEQDADPWPDADTVAALSDDRVSNIDLTMVPSHTQARRLMKRGFIRANAAWRGTVLTNLAGLRAVDERFIWVTDDEIGINESFEILNFQFDPNEMQCVIDIASVGDEVDDWDKTTEEGTPPSDDPLAADLIESGSINGTLSSAGVTNLTQAFNGDPSETAANCAVGPDTGAIFGVSFYYIGSRIKRLHVFGATDQGFVQGANPTVTLELYGKKGGLPLNGTDGDLLGSISFTDANEDGDGKWIESNDRQSRFNAIWVRITHDAGGGENVLLAEFDPYA